MRIRKQAVCGKAIQFLQPVSSFSMHALVCYFGKKRRIKAAGMWWLLPLHTPDWMDPSLQRGLLEDACAFEAWAFTSQHSAFYKGCQLTAVLAAVQNAVRYLVTVLIALVFGTVFYKYGQDT